MSLSTNRLLAPLLTFTVFAAFANAQTGAPNHAQLMTSLFGNYDIAHHWSLWRPANVPHDFQQFFKDGTGKTSVEEDFLYYDGSIAKRMFVFSTIPDGEPEYDCHACDVLLSAVIFRDGSLEPEARADYLTIGGSVGRCT